MPVDKATFIQQVTERMERLVDSDDEYAHEDAEDLILSALSSEGGYDEVIELYRRVPH